jgi:D-alanine-D-alanine ligase
MKILILYNNDFQKLSADAFCGDLARAGVLVAVDSVKAALLQNGYTVSVKGINDKSEMGDSINQCMPDLAFNLCESLQGDSFGEIEVVKELEKLKTPFTGNSSDALSLCLNKFECVQKLKNVVAVPKSTLDHEQHDLSYPVIVKPNMEDGSTGIDQNAVAHNFTQLKRQISKMSSQAIIQEYIDGRELNISVIGSKPVKEIGVFEIDFSKLNNGYHKIVNYASKWLEDSHEYKTITSMPVKLEDNLQKQIKFISEKVVETLGLSNYARIDLRLNSDGVAYVIDVNPNCDLDPGAGFAKTIGHMGIDYKTLINLLVKDAYNSFH